MDILTYFLEHSPEHTVGLLPSSPSSSNHILKYIEDHIAEPLTLERLAGEFHYNPNYFIRYFKSMFKMSPIQYIGMVRIENAKRLLIETEWTIEKIARAVGLDRFYFSKTFRQVTSLSPSMYRKMHRTELSRSSAE
ncbi:AraC family transcriptional regulator [Paenibacillus sp. UNC451MF]|uniref:AraC family transcriptional regulator n=1 Tax=Paenibacillus sp. UNC451MF TaxID=1449063 RepID=UPI0018CC6543|nr:AraC family transcriptional regulator [Paenibacillus sp. UNC451MF]